MDTSPYGEPAHLAGLRRIFDGPEVHSLQPNYDWRYVKCFLLKPPKGEDYRSPAAKEYFEQWADCRVFSGAEDAETQLEKCNRVLEEYHNRKEDVSGWEKVTEPLMKLKSDLSNSETRLEKISISIGQIEGQAARKSEMLNSVTQARVEISGIRDNIAKFETKTNTIKQDKENELRNRKNEIDSLKQSGNHQLTYSDPDVRIELTDLFVNRERIPGSTFTNFKIKLTLMVISKSKIVKPRTAMIYSSERAYSSEHNRNVIIVDPITIEVPIGVEIEDNFGNNLGLGSIRPSYYGGETGRSLRPSESEIFTISPNDAPLKNTESLTVKVSAGTFGNTKPFELVIPKSIINTVLKEMP